MIKNITKWTLIIGVLMIVTTTFADVRAMDIGFQLGNWSQEDDKVKETFGSDFFMGGQVGIIDLDLGLEARIMLGQYESKSHHIDDVGDNTTLRIIPLTGSVIYNFFRKESFLAPYVGGGVGAYFYKVQNDPYGTIEDKSKFGPHLLTGVKVHLNPSIYLSAEYDYHFLSKAIFNNADNFNQSNITFGMGFMFVQQRQSRTSDPISYAKSNDPLEDQIKALNEEIEVMKAKRAEMSSTIDTFYLRTDFQKTTSLMSALDANQDIVSGELSVIDPNTQEVKIKGTVSGVSKPKESKKVVLTIKQNHWTTTVSLYRNPISVSIGDEGLPSITQANVDHAVLISTIQNSEEFAKELDKVHYLESRLVDLDKQIKQAQADFKELSEQYEQRRKYDVQNNNIPTTLIYQTYPNIDYHPRYRDRYRYYDAPYYGVPSSQPSRPVSEEDKEKYIQKKKEYINKFKSR